MDAVKFMQSRQKRIEQLEEALSDVQSDIDGAEVVHNGREAIIMEVDWEASFVYLNYDDENFEWVEF